ncbi:malonic semialdehyde reductase [Dongia soli]|uniref:Putative NADH dehydrogenase/NAD(P)H nitroreductase SMD27_04905 n=1 Tax=Dongia soli TaxID=600628 RepID=A0ABU5E8I4_9PROT|nr:malonic semialdehyde reductase [Dongia soli]MDY0882171.1 malonic semialdehyde reductase [Dongia soli]
MVLDAAAIDLLFLKAHTQRRWLDREVPDPLLRQIYELARMGPTSANCQPLRIDFVRSPAAKEKLRPALSEGNVEQTMSAPATAVFAADHEFYEFLPKLFPQADAKSWFTGSEAATRETAQMNATLQAGYFIMAARGLGLDCGPMSGFDRAKVNAAFFSGSAWKALFLCNLGYGDPTGYRPRNPRLDFSEACRIA